MIVGVVDGVEELSRLWQEGADLAVAPAAHQRFSVVHELRAVALQAQDLNSEQLLSGLRIPDSDVVDGAGREEFAESVRKRQVVDLGVVASVPEFWLDGVCVRPINGRLVGSNESVGSIGGERERSDHLLV